MALKNYSASSLIGGGSGSLDSIDGTNLTDLDSALVFTADTFYFYILNAASAAAESSPDIISPDANAGNKRWILIFSMGTSGVITLSNTGLHLLDTGGNHDLIIKPGSDVTADRTLTLTTGDASRTITLSGNPTLADWFDQAVKAASSPTFADVTIAAATGITFANSGLHVLDTNASHDLVITPGSDLTVDRILTLATGDAARTITLSGDPTLADWFDQAVKAASSPTFADVTIAAATGITFANSGLHVLDTNASHDLIITPGSDLTADRILTIATGDAARTITLSGNPTLADWFDQAVKAASSPTFAGLSLTADLAVAEGGTGASTAAAARTNLSAAVLGANSDITSLAGLTTPLTKAQGGSGTTGDSIIKGWIKCNAAGAIADSYNVTSITDVGVGLVRVTWDIDFANTAYVCVGTAESDLANGGVNLITVDQGTQAVGSVDMQATNSADGARRDPRSYHVIAIGDR